MYCVCMHIHRLSAVTKVILLQETGFVRNSCFVLYFIGAMIGKSLDLPGGVAVLASPSQLINLGLFPYGVISIAFKKTLVFTGLLLGA